MVIPCSNHKSPDAFFDGLNDHYSVGAMLAKNILFGLSGADPEIANQKWDEMSEIVYNIVKIADVQSDLIYHRSHAQSEVVSIGTLFITEFLLLFFSNKKIRDIVNRMETVENESNSLAH